jgi:hypothetical protein
LDLHWGGDTEPVMLELCKQDFTDGLEGCGVGNCGETLVIGTTGGVLGEELTLRTLPSGTT